MSFVVGSTVQYNYVPHTDCMYVLPGSRRQSGSSYVEAFEDEIRAFRARVKARARQKVEAAMKEAEEVRQGRGRERRKETERESLYIV